MANGSSDDLGLLSDSAPESLSDWEPHADEDLRQGSFDSDEESDREKENRVNDESARPHKRKPPSVQGPLRKLVCQDRGRSSGDTRGSGATLEESFGEEVKSSLKEITFLLNTVVQRVEKVENELQRRKGTSLSSSSDVTPPRPKPPLIVKVTAVCLLHNHPLKFVMQAEVRRVYRDLLESDDRSFTGFDLSCSHYSFFICF